MFSKLNTKTLLVLIVLMGAVVLYTFLDENKGERTFRNEFVSVDTSSVSTILLYPKAGGGQEIKFAKANGEWKISNGKITTGIDQQTISGLLGSFVSLKSQSLASNNPAQWDSLMVGDTSATHIKFISSSKTWDILVGKFAYNNQTRSGSTCVRMSGEKEVYTVEGYLTFTVNQPFNSWRNRFITKDGQEKWNKISFMYPADSGFVMTRDSLGWKIDGQRCDSAAAASFIQSAAFISSSDFLDDFKQGALQPKITVAIESENGDRITVQAFPFEENNLAIHSSLNPEAFFDDAKSGVSGKLFRSRQYFFASPSVDAGAVKAK